MNELLILFKIISSTILAVNSSIDNLVWNSLLFVFVIGGIIGAIILSSYSKKPEEWKHESRIEGDYNSGRLKGLADSIKINPVDDSDNAPIKRLIQIIFFEKYRAIHGISPEELMNLKTKDKVRLRQIIGDEEIANWILNVNSENKNKFFKKGKISKKERYLMDINSVLDKMEVWGE